MSVRTYLAFGSDNKLDWRVLEPVTASGPDQARNLAQTQDGAWQHYAVVPARNWSAGTPTTKTIVSWDDLELPGQMTVDDVLVAQEDEEDEQQQDDQERIGALVEKARGALHDEPDA